MIQAQGLRRRPGGMIPLLLIFSILCLLAGELACGSACQTMPQRFPCAVSRQERLQPLSDLPEEIQQESMAGKSVASEKELYGFLENYSS